MVMRIVINDREVTNPFVSNLSWLTEPFLPKEPLRVSFWAPSPSAPGVIKGSLQVNIDKRHH